MGNHGTHSMLRFTGHPAASHSATLFSIASALLAAGCAPPASQVAAAGDGHHEVPEPVSVTVFTDQVELFMEYPRLVPGLEARFLAHVTVLATGEPVRSGQLRLELSQGAVSTGVFEAASPTRDGLFIPVGALTTPGEHAAKIVVISDQVEETIPLAPIVVHRDLHSALAAAAAEESAEPANAVPFLLEQAWPIGLLLEQVEQRSLTQRLQVPGEIEAPYYARAVVSAPLGGRLLPPNSGKIPHVGELVEEGQILAYLETPLTTAERAQLAANTTSHAAVTMALLTEEYALQAKTIEVQLALLQSQTRLKFARQALARIDELRANDLGTEADLEAARRDVELALQATQSSEALQDSLEVSNSRLAALRERELANYAAASELKQMRHPLIAPISGEVIELGHIEGESVEIHSAVFSLIDMTRAWLVVHISEFDLAAVGDEPGALMSLAAFPDRSFDIHGDLGGRIVSFGQVVDPETRSLPLRFEITNPEGLLRAGMFADVFLETGRVIDAVALPQEAIVMDNGQPVAFVLIHGELYQKRVLELGIRDGRLVEVLSGIEAGERVVTHGAYLVHLAAASPASFGAGHAH